MNTDFFTYNKNGIHIFKFRRSTDAAVEAWAAAIEAAIVEAPADRPFYLLLDVAGDEVSFTPLARKQSKRIFSVYRQRVGYIALVFQWRTSPYFARLFFSTLGKLAFQLRYFTDEDAALVWLAEQHRNNT